MVCEGDCDDNNPAIWECNTPVSDIPVVISDETGKVTVTFPKVISGGNTTIIIFDLVFINRYLQGFPQIVPSVIRANNPNLPTDEEIGSAVEALKPSCP
ncbi:MAG: hypothetical protein ACMUIU_12600 [bacterium]